MLLLKKAKWKHVALSEVKMDCRFRKLSPFFCQFLPAIGESEKDCRHIIFWAMLPIAETPWKASNIAI